MRPIRGADRAVRDPLSAQSSNSGASAAQCTGSPGAPDSAAISVAPSSRIRQVALTSAGGVAVMLVGSPAMTSDFVIHAGCAAGLPSAPFAPASVRIVPTAFSNWPSRRDSMSR